MNPDPGFNLDEFFTARVVSLQKWNAGVAEFVSLAVLIRERRRRALRPGAFDLRRLRP